MVKRKRFGTSLALAALLSACSSGGGGSGSIAAGGSGGGGSTPTPSPTPGVAGCSLRERQDWAFAVLKEWYLFPATLPATLNPAPYVTLDDYVDALTATARSQRKDRYFTYVTSIAEENAYYSSGSSAGYGMRLTYDGSRLLVPESFEGGPALAGGVDRGAEILGIGTSTANIRTIANLVASTGSTQGIVDALGPSTAGTTRVFQVRDAGGTRNVTITQADFDITPVSSRYGVRIINNGGQQVGYVNLRTFISTADPALRNAFAQFKAAGITNIIVDLRYNGGGLVSIAELLGNLMGANRTTSEVFDYTTFRPEKASNNEVTYFAPQPQSIAPTRIAFIGTGGTASASEMAINGMLPYLRANEALIGGNTYGKPVGQIAIDRTACDDRFRVIAFAVENRDHQGAYYDGLADKVDVTCRAADDINYPLGDPAEASTRVALDYLAGRSCTAIAAAPGSLSRSATSVPAPDPEPLMPERPSATQREVPGFF